MLYSNHDNNHKKILATVSILAMVTFAVSAPYARAENENGSGSDDKITNVSSLHKEGKTTTKSHLKTKTKKTKKKSKKRAIISKTSPTTIAPTISNTTTIPTATITSYSMAEVAIANTKSKCWTVISGKVYNLTDWIAQHPGGEGAILSICGRDGTTAFNAQHGGQGRPEQELKTFLIGTLK